VGVECGTYVGREDMHAEFWSRNLRERDHLDDLGVDGRIILKCFFRKFVVVVCTGLT
jgi:hypothetical protein